MLGSKGDKSDRLTTRRGGDVVADERYRLDAMFVAVASFIIHGSDDGRPT